MRVTVVDVGEMGVAVNQRFVPVRVAVGGAGRHRFGMDMLVMQIMFMPVVVLEKLVDMHMRVTLAQVQPYTGGHQQARHHQASAQRLVQQEQRQHGAEERCNGEVRTGTRRADVAQPDHV